MYDFLEDFKVYSIRFKVEILVYFKKRKKKVIIVFFRIYILFVVLIGILGLGINIIG